MHVTQHRLEALTLPFYILCGSLDSNLVCQVCGQTPALCKPSPCPQANNLKNNHRMRNNRAIKMSHLKLLL